MVRCKRCGLPQTYETIEFDANGVCNICTQTEFKLEVIDWQSRKLMLDQLIEEYRGKADYDMIIPFSGGKDSTFTLLYLIREYKIKPLVVQFNHGFMRPNLLKNNERTFKKLGVDSLSFTPNWKIVKRLMKESLIRKGDFCWHCHTGIFSFPMHIAIKFRVPLVLWGEPSSEYTAYYDYRDNEIEQVNEERFNRYINLGITAEDMLEMVNSDSDISERDLRPYSYPKLKDLRDLGYQSATLGSFIPWDAKKQSGLIAEELGWKGDQVEGMPGGYEYEKIECFMQGSRDYLKFLKRGYSRPSQMIALDIRNGRLTLEQGMKLVADYEGKRPASLDILLEYLEMSEEEFNEVAKRTSVPPFKPDFSKIVPGERTPDFEYWYRETKH